METENIIVGFIGAGGIARAHAYSLNSLRYFYNNAPSVEMAAVCSATEESRKAFCKRFGFLRSCDTDSFLADDRINSVFILGPNKVHYEHLRAALKMSAVKRIYLEKPVCSNISEELAISELVHDRPDIHIQVGFQFLFTAAIRQALAYWKMGEIGKPIHFDLKYYHSDYLQKEYRGRRASRLTPAPDGGAMADLGSHALSLAIAFFGTQLQITNALQAGRFDDVPEDSDLFSQISIYDNNTGAVGSVSASRISSGTGDLVSFELFAERGAIRYNTGCPDSFEFYTAESGVWSRKYVGSDYNPSGSFPSAHVPPGWLRSLIHAHYVFLTGNDAGQFVPDIEHGLAVQSLVTETAEHLKTFRKSVGNRQ